jgi:hypothetical protein
MSRRYASDMSIQQRREVEWHIQAGDYFGTLATVLDLLRQLMDKQGYGRTEARLLEEVRDELVYLQESHRIVKRSSGSSGLKHPKACR